MKEYGFYWVRFRNENEWVVARRYDDGEWMTCGNEVGWSQSEFAEIGPRIEPPT